MADEAVDISWAWGGSLQHPSGKHLTGHSSTIVGDRVYILCRARGASFLEFSLHSFQWTHIPLGAYSNASHTACLVDDTIFFVGGHSPPGVRGMLAIFNVVSKELLVVPDLKEDLLRVDHTSVYVPRRREILVYGGIRVGRVVGNLCALNVDTHDVRQLRAKGKAPPRMFGHGALFRRDRMYIFGPKRDEEGREEAFTVYVLEMTEGLGERWWQVLGPGGRHGIPDRRYFAMLTHGCHVLVFGGRTLDGANNDLQHEYLMTSDLVTFDLNAHAFRRFEGPNGRLVNDEEKSESVRVQVHGSWPPPLQRHSTVAWKDGMLFFGGQTDAVYLLSFSKNMLRSR